MSGSIEWSVSATGKERQNALGYAASNIALRKHIGRRIEIRDGAPVTVSYCYPKLFVPRPGAFNVLFTMYESDKLDRNFAPAFEKADLILTPSEWCAEVFRGSTDKPVEVVPLGVDLSLFRYKRRRPKRGDRLRFLYVGAPNPRKMTILGELHLALFKKIPNVELYMKTTGARWDEASLADTLSNDPSAEIIEDGLIRGDQWTLDNRYLPSADLVSLYHSAHAFLHLHCGEGWGLTSLEAMATGLAPIVTDWSGTRDFANRKNAFLVDANYKSIDCEDGEGRPIEQWVGWPDPAAAMVHICEIVKDYRQSTLRGKAAAECAKRFSWEASAKRFCDVLRSYGVA